MLVESEHYNKKTFVGEDMQTIKNYWIISGKR